MITLLVDEAYAFDYLSILSIKTELKKEYIMVFDSISEHVQNQIGRELFEKIINSQEYKNMIAANKKTFDAVDQAKTDACSASYVDKCNYERHSAKESLQKKFFGSDIKELKIGYEKYKI